jgi:hypothetical protein
MSVNAKKITNLHLIQKKFVLLHSQKNKDMLDKEFKYYIDNQSELVKKFNHRLLLSLEKKLLVITTVLNRHCPNQ